MSSTIRRVIRGFERGAEEQPAIEAEAAPQKATTMSQKRTAYRKAQQEFGYGAPESRAAYHAYTEAKAEADEENAVRITNLRNGAVLKRRGRGNRTIVTG